MKKKFITVNEFSTLVPAAKALTEEEKNAISREYLRLHREVLRSKLPELGDPIAVKRKHLELVNRAIHYATLVRFYSIRVTESILSPIVCN